MTTEATTPKVTTTLKGMTRVAIAESVVAKLETKLAAARKRLEKAMADEKAGAGQRAEKAAKTRERALKTLEAAGMSRKAAEAALNANTK